MLHKKGDQDRDHAPASIVALLDFEKAFDRVCHSYLARLLPRLGFPHAFVDTVRCLYTGRQSRLLVNGRLSRAFDIKRGVLQGDPLSPLLFVLAMEPLCNLLRSRPDLGVQIGGVNHVASCFADDTQLIARDEPALHTQLALVERFSRATNQGSRDLGRASSWPTRSLRLRPRQVCGSASALVVQVEHARGQGGHSPHPLPAASLVPAGMGDALGHGRCVHRPHDASIPAQRADRAPE
uniref:Reverse transcriptase domain-containing protein n=1 Tax=Hucho hucho TaxID=62062 RepID=A0A4W5LMU1_9TELE